MYKTTLGEDSAINVAVNLFITWKNTIEFKLNLPFLQYMSNTKTVNSLFPIYILISPFLTGFQMKFYFMW